MNFEYFISKKLIKTKGYKSKVSSPIIKIAVTAITIGIIMMILAFGTGLGLQQKIRDKITAFNGHITIRSFTTNQSNQNLYPIDARQDFYPDFKTVPDITIFKKPLQNMVSSAQKPILKVLLLKVFQPITIGLISTNL